jgi:hypothetical protein
VQITMGGPMGRLQEWSCILGHRLNLDVFESTKLMLLQGVAMYDAAVAAWEAKRFYQHPRPISVIQCAYANDTIRTWLGPYQGVGEVKGAHWWPYTEPAASTPPFPGYIRRALALIAAASCDSDDVSVICFDCFFFALSCYDLCCCMALHCYGCWSDIQLFIMVCVALQWLF